MNTEILNIVLPAASAFCALVCLGFLFIIDLKTRLLPNNYVFALALLGVAFHVSLGFEFLTPSDMAGGMIVGGGLLLIIRTLGNKVYNQDTLGLGDVKLMMAAGLWLGVQDVLSALVIGASLGIFHGIGLALYEARRDGRAVDISQFSLPAGPGFILGIVIIAIYNFSGVFI